MSRLAVVALLAGCGGWPALEPEEHPHALDPRLGVEVDRSVHAFRYAAIHQASGLFLAYEETSVGWRAVEVAPDGAIEAWPDPPLVAGESVSIGRALAPDRAVIAVRRAGRVVILRLGEDWAALPPVPDADASTVVGGVLAHDDRVYVALGTSMWMWDGAWRRLSTGGTIPPGLGGFDAATQWVLTHDGTALVATAFDATGAPGTVASIVAGPPEGSAVNGDATHFQVAAGGMLYTFDGVTFTAGDPSPGPAFAAPGSDRILVSDGASGAAATWRFVDDGRVGDVALAPFTPAITCGCEITTDPSCGCVPGAVDSVILRPAPDTARLAVVAADDLDGYAVLAVRFLDLPFAGDPFESSARE